MKYLKEKKYLILAGIICGIVAMLLAIFDNPKNMAICVACFIRDTAGALGLHRATAVQFVRPEIIGIVLGALIIALCTKEYKSIGGSSPMIRFLLGIMMIIGALVFLGCPLRMILRMSAGDLNAWVGLVGFVLGVGTGVIALRMGYTLGKNHETNLTSGFVAPFLLVVIFILALTTNLLFQSESGPGSMHAPVLISLTGGLVFGAVAQRSRMCFGGAFRDSIMIKNFDKLLIIGALFIVMLIYNIASGNFNFGFKDQPIAHTEWLWNILGMYVVGFAAVLAGGCPLRQLILTGQGSSDAAVTVLGMFAGGALAHNLNLASSATGTTLNGRVAVLICLAFLFIIAYLNRRQEANA